MTRESNAEIKLDVRESTADWDAFMPPQGAPDMPVVLYDTGQAAWFFDIADDAYIDVEAHLQAAYARD